MVRLPVVVLPLTIPASPSLYKALQATHKGKYILLFNKWTEREVPLLIDCKFI